MELILKLKDESKLDALLAALRRFIASEGIDLAVESLERNVVLESPVVPESSQDDFDWARFHEILDRPKLRPGQPEMSPEEEEAWIAEEIMAMRAEERAQKGV